MFQMSRQQPQSTQNGGGGGLALSRYPPPTMNEITSAAFLHDEAPIKRKDRATHAQVQPGKFCSLLLLLLLLFRSEVCGVPHTTRQA